MRSANNYNIVKFSNINSNQNVSYKSPASIGLCCNRISFKPIITPKSIVYVSGNERLTQFIFMPNSGFRVICWGRRYNKMMVPETYILTDSNFEWQIEAVWRIFRDDVDHGRACLSDSTNLLGNNKIKNRTVSKYSFKQRNGCIDGFSAIVCWLNKCERTINKMLKTQKEEENKTVELLNQGFDIEDLKQMGMRIPKYLIPNCRDEEVEQIEEKEQFTYQDLEELLESMFQYANSPKASTLIKKRSIEEQKQQLTKRIERQNNIAELNFEKAKNELQRAKFIENNDNPNHHYSFDQIKHHEMLGNQHYERYKHFKMLVDTTQERIEQIDGINQLDDSLDSYFTEKLNSALSNYNNNF